MRGAIPVDRRYAKIRIVAGVLRHFRERGSLQPQVHLYGHRARHGVDDFDQPQPPRFGRVGFGVTRDKEEIRKITPEARGHVRPQYLHRNRFTDAALLGFAAMNLGDRGSGDRRAEAGKSLCHRPIQRLRDNGFSFGLRKRRQPVLQAFQIARHHHADDIGTGGEELAELQVSRSEPRQRPREAWTGFGSGSLDDPSQAKRELSGGRYQRRINDTEHPFAREHKTGAGEPRDVGQGRDHKRQPECTATMPPERLCQLTREKPAALIISANAFGLGNLRIDSTR